MLSSTEFKWATESDKEISIIVRPTSPQVIETPCDPHPCGPNSNCRAVGSSPVCSCQPGYLGVPPECRPECVSNGECSPSLSCVNFKCQDPCTGTCGPSATCTVINHNPVCSCPSGTTGDPLTTGCRPPPSKKNSKARFKKLGILLIYIYLNIIINQQL